MCGTFFKMLDAFFGKINNLPLQNEWKRRWVYFKNQMWKSEIIFMYISMDLDQSESSFKQLEYFSMANWKKIRNIDNINQRINF